MFILRQTRGSTPSNQSVLSRNPESGQRLRHQPDSVSAAPAAVVPRTRISSIWIGLGTVVVVFIALIVFALQNLHTMQVSFLGLHGTLPAAVALLIAMVAGVVPGMVFGAARTTQVRRPAHRRRG